MSKNGLSEIDNKIRTRAQETYGDKTVYDHFQQSIFAKGAEFGYSLSLDRIAELEKEVERLKGVAYKAFHKFYMRGFPHNEPSWEQFKKENNL